jgi:hypothetical protein
VRQRDSRMRRARLLTPQKKPYADHADESGTRHHDT